MKLLVIIAANLEGKSHIKLKERGTCFALLGVKEALLVALSVLSLKMSTARALDVPWARKKYDKRDVLF